MSKSAAASTPAEKSNYQEGNLTIQKGLEESIDLLIQRKGFATTTKEMETIQIKLPRLKAELLTVDSELTAFLANQLSVNPPSEDQVTQMKKVTEDIYKLSAGSDLADSIVTTATTLIQKWASTRA